MRAVILILSVMLLSAGCNSREEPLPRVFVFTDINISRGDPDDRQSLVHLLWYANELDIVSVVPDRWNAGGPEACRLAIEAYAEDYHRYGFEEKGYPAVQTVRDWIASDEQDAIGRLHQAATEGNDPLYVLVWGNMLTLRNALREHPEIADHIRVISIGTGLKYGPRDEVPGEDCTVPNWNGPGHGHSLLCLVQPRSRKDGGVDGTQMIHHRRADQAQSCSRRFVREDSVLSSRASSPHARRDPAA